MKDLSILQPVLLQVGLTFVLLFWMGAARFAEVKAGTLDMDAAGNRPKWPGRAGTLSNAFHNQLEMPMLFYAAVAFAMLANAVDWEMTALAWAYAICRLVQAVIHTTYNTVMHRFLAFMAGNVVLIAMWVNIALTVMLGW